MRPRHSVRPFARLRSRKGQALVEFALAAPVLCLLLFATFEFGRHYYARFTVRHAIAEAARFGATGQQLEDPESGEPLTRSESMLQLIDSGVAKVPVELVEIELDPPDAGGPGDVVQILATYRFHFLGARVIRRFAPPHVDFTAAVTVKNEPVF